MGRAKPMSPKAGVTKQRKRRYGCGGKLSKKQRPIQDRTVFTKGNAYAIGYYLFSKYSFVIL